MSIEETMYGAGWRFCARCGTKRPPQALTNGECTERTWCEKVMPSCDVCGIPVEQPEKAGRPRKRHAACRGLAAKLRASGALTPENVATARIGNDSGIGEGRQP